MVMANVVLIRHGMPQLYDEMRSGLNYIMWVYLHAHGGGAYSLFGICSRPSACVSSFFYQLLNILEV